MQLITSVCYILILSNTFSPCQSDIVSEKGNDNNCDVRTECCTSECIAAAENLKKSINPDFDPCEDFYEFACGKFLNTTKTADFGAFERLEENLLEMYFGIFNDTVMENDTNTVKIMKQTFQTCLGENRIRQDSVNSLRSILDSQGGWPVLAENWTETNYSLFDLLVYTRVSGFDIKTLFYEKTRMNGKLYVDLLAAFPILNRELLIRGFTDHRVQAYHKLMVAVVTALGGNETIAKKDMRDVVEFEIKMNKAFYYKNHNLPNDIYQAILNFQNETGKMKLTRDRMFRMNYLRMEDIDDWLPGFRWRDYFNITWTDFYNATGEETIALNHPLTTLWTLVLLNTVPKRTITNFVLWSYVYEMIPTLNSDLRDLRLRFLESFKRFVSIKPRLEECTDLVLNSFTTEVAEAMTEKYFTKVYVSHAENLVEVMKEQLLRSITNITWMNGTDKLEAMLKVQKMRQTIPFPLTSAYAYPAVKAFSNMKVNSSYTFVENFKQVNIYANTRNMGNLVQGITVSELDYFSDIHRTMEFYQVHENLLKTPIGYLQTFLFEDNRPMYLNYGGIGTKLGHTMFHSIDNEGKDYDERGRRRTWWGRDTKENYKSVSQCFIEQYKIFVPEIEEYISSDLSVDENFADNVATNITYSALLKRINETRADKKLPGLNYTSTQLFWLQYANGNCQQEDFDSLTVKVSYLGQTPKKYRVNVPLGNSIYFLKDWQCNNESKMGSQKICDIW